MNTIYRLTTLFALTLSALGADVKFSALPTATSPSTNSYLPIIDLNLLPAAQNEKYLLTNLATVAQLSTATNALTNYVTSSQLTTTTNSLTNSFVLKSGDTMTGELTGTSAQFNSLVTTGTVYRANLPTNTTSEQVLIDWNESQSGGQKQLVVSGASGAAPQSMYLKLTDKIGYGFRIAANNAGIQQETAILNSVGSGAFWCSSTGIGTAGTKLLFGAPYSVYAPTVALEAESANTLALRNGANAQTFNVYNTYTDAANYERGEMSWAFDTLYIGTKSAGTGVGRGVNLMFNGASIWTINGSGFLASVDNTYDIGASGANRPRNVYVGSAIAAVSSITAGTYSIGTSGVVTGSGVDSIKLLNPSAGVLQLDTYNAGRFNSIQGGTTKVCTSAVSNALFYVSIPNTNMIGGRVLYTVNSTDGTDAQQITGTLQFGAVGKATAVTANVTDVQNTSTVSAGTLTATLTANVSTNNVFALMVTPTTSLTTTNLTVRWRLETPSTYVVNAL